jgi:hypothetical protein
MPTAKETPLTTEDAPPPPDEAVAVGAYLDALTNGVPANAADEAEVLQEKAAASSDLLERLNLFNAAVLARDNAADPMADLRAGFVANVFTYSNELGITAKAWDELAKTLEAGPRRNLRAALKEGGIDLPGPGRRPGSGRVSSATGRTRTPVPTPGEVELYLSKVPNPFTLSDLARLVDDGKTPNQPSRLKNALGSLVEAGTLVVSHAGGPGDPTRWSKSD